jgi:hypothetical protein
MDTAGNNGRLEYKERMACFSVPGNAVDPSRDHEGRTIHALPNRIFMMRFMPGSTRFMETGQGTAKVWSISIPKGIVNTSSALLIFLNN